MLQQYPADYCFEKEEFKKKVRIFASPADIQEIFMHGNRDIVLKTCT